MLVLLFLYLFGRFLKGFLPSSGRLLGNLANQFPVAVAFRFSIDLVRRRVVQPLSAYRAVKVALNALTRMWDAEHPACWSIRFARAGSRPTWEDSEDAMSAMAPPESFGLPPLPGDGPTGGFFPDGQPISW